MKTVRKHFHLMIGEPGEILADAELALRLANEGALANGAIEGEHVMDTRVPHYHSRADGHHGWSGPLGYSRRTLPEPQMLRDGPALVDVHVDRTGRVRTH